jgi:hypothetical protein
VSASPPTGGVPGYEPGVNGPAKVSRAVSEAAGAEALSPERAATILPAGLLHDDEIILLLTRPSPLFIVLSCLPGLALIGLLTLLMAYLAPHVARWQPFVSWTDVHAFAGGLLVVLLRLSWQSLEWLGRVYVLTDRRIIRRIGVLRVAVFETSLRNIQHTSVFERVRERVFGLGTIGFATAGSDVYEAFWEMIRKPFVVHKIVGEAIQRYGRR